jgi:GxxExxY protein
MVSYPRRLQSGHITCYLNRTYHVLTTVRLDCGYRLDLVVADCVIVKIKAVEKLNSVHDAQLLSYLKLANCRVGLLLNFHCTMLKNGIRRLVNNFPISATSAISAVK